jgi:membrane protein YqaA with SNARE-associated domain
VLALWLQMPDERGMSIFLAYAGLFSASFLAATLLPMQSEAVLLTMMASEKFIPWLLLLVASCGNILGSLVNWWMGRALLQFQHRRWVPFSAEQISRAQGWYQHFGQWTLLASWMPIIGDPLTLIAGVMRMPLWRFLLLVTVAKTARYFLLIQLWQSF